MSTTGSLESPESTETSAVWGGGVDSIRAMLEQLRESAGVESVYGDPVEAAGKTIVPVARVAYAFGGGFGRGEEADEEGGEGAGGGGGVSATPVGVVEITEDDTRFVRFGDRKRLGLAVFGGVLLGLLLGRR